eukprot:CAMPEP_0114141682 /NCGR_PEP_ID=MMETSP0043_2-20121206/18039_1 /TAXON_ID=464988 /ORGANISM="Hemiselmis andersenii, Strain CCMP644" /LENGTH=46 /DNA_ID= /DNA_START= /DNA_END= /DNA_ORIENTATION=
MGRSTTSSTEGLRGLKCHLLPLLSHKALTANTPVSATGARRLLSYE